MGLRVRTLAPDGESGGKTPCIRRDVLAITADNGRRGRAGHDAGTGFEHRIDLLAHHETGFVLRIVIAEREFVKPEMNDLEGFERQHDAGKPREAARRGDRPRR